MYFNIFIDFNILRLLKFKSKTKNRLDQTCKKTGPNLHYQSSKEPITRPKTGNPVSWRRSKRSTQDPNGVWSSSSWLIEERPLYNIKILVTLKFRRTHKLHQQSTTYSSINSNYLYKTKRGNGNKKCFAYFSEKLTRFLFF